MNIEKTDILPYALMLLAGGSVGTGSSLLTSQQAQHEHPAIIKVIKIVQYELELDTVVLRLDAMDRNGVPKDDRNYRLFTQIQADLTSRLKDLEQ